jgi:hypothetical protein
MSMKASILPGWPVAKTHREALLAHDFGFAA